MRPGVALPLVLISFLFLTTGKSTTGHCRWAVTQMNSRKHIWAESISIRMLWVLFSWTPDPKRLVLDSVFFHHLLRLRSPGIKAWEKFIKWSCDQRQELVCKEPGPIAGWHCSVKLCFCQVMWSDESLYKELACVSSLNWRSPKWPRFCFCHRSAGCYGPSSWKSLRETDLGSP